MTPRNRHAANIAALQLLRDQVNLQTLEATKGPAALAAARICLEDYSGYGDAQTQGYAFDALDRPIGALAALKLPTSWVQSIRRSTLDAYYTPRDIATAMWSIVSDLLPLDHNTLVLEPACGTGIFIRTAPDIIAHHNIAAIECDDVGAAITQTLYPAVRLAHQRFEVAARSLPDFDVVIGNVPFGDVKVVEAGGEGTALPEPCCRSLHDYFICRAVQQLRRGGVAVLLTSTGTLGKIRDSARRWLAQRAEVVFAARLPLGSFDTTQAQADLLVLRRRVADVFVPTDKWIATTRLTSDLQNSKPLPARGVGWAAALLRDHSLATVDVNHWFRCHPETGLGDWFACRTQYGRTEAAVRRTGNVAEQLLAAWKIHQPVAALNAIGSPATPAKPASAPAPLPPLERAAKRLVEAVHFVLAAQQSHPDRVDAAQRLLLGLYEDFRNRFGTVRAVEPRRLCDAELRRSWPLLRLCETSDGNRGAIFAEQIVSLTSAQQSSSVDDALYIVLNTRGCVDIDAISDVLVASAQPKPRA